MADVAYAPKAGREDPDHFGAVFVNDFKSINVREALETGNGYIVTSDPDEQRALDMIDSLKHVTVGEARGEMPAEAAEGAVADDLDGRTKDELLALPEVADVSKAGALKVDDLRAAIRRARAENEEV
jgi:hypothetical protein